MLTLFSIVSYSQERELSDYEKYRLEQETKLYPEDEDFICWDVVEEMPKFNGKAPDEFRNWISLNVEYPKEARDEKIRGKVFVEFVVDKYGNVVRVRVPKPVDPLLDAEAIRVVMSSPKWTPGFQGGTPVNVQFTFPINFVLKDDIPEGPAVVNNYYNYDYDYGFRSRLYFDTWYYRPYNNYSYYDPFYYDYWYGYNPYYYGGYYSYGGYNGYYQPHYHYTYYNKSYGREYARSSSLGWNRSYYTPYNKTYRSGYMNSPTAMKKNVTTRPQTTTRSKSTYTPTYTKPRMDTKPSYNATTRRTTTVTAPRSQSRSVQQSTRTNYNRPSTSSTYSRPATSSRSTYSRPSSPSRSSSSYSTPSRSSSSYSAPSRSSSSYSRSSSSSSSGRSYSSGSASRSSGSRSGGKK